jgi:hypothetical protein
MGRFGGGGLISDWLSKRAGGNGFLGHSIKVGRRKKADQPAFVSGIDSLEKEGLATYQIY